MKLNFKNLLILISLILICFLFSLYWNNRKQTIFFEKEYFGIVENIKSSRKFENSKVIKLKNHSDYNYDFWIYAPLKNDLNINDSISKNKNSFDYKIYRKNGFNNKFKFYKILQNKSYKN